MKYTKPALSLPDIVTRLQNKGLVIANTAGAEKFLRATGYFRFRGYALPFTRQAPVGSAHGSRVFVAGTTFEHVQGVYEFDRCLRGLVMEQIDRIEVAARAAILYELNKQFGPHWYLDFSKKIFKNTSEQTKWFNQVAGEVQRSKEKFIRHYFDTYTDPLLPPSWAVAECISFGKWSTLYEELAHAKSAIASTFGLSAPVLESWLHSLNVLRNNCAHHSRTWNKKFSFPPKPHPHYSTHFAAPNNSFYNRAAAIRILTNSIDGNQFFRDGLRYLFANNPSIAPADLGFPINWDKDPLWS